MGKGVARAPGGAPEPEVWAFAHSALKTAKRKETIVARLMKDNTYVNVSHSVHACI
jgi:hypothetical protein